MSSELVASSESVAQHSTPTSLIASGIGSLPDEVIRMIAIYLEMDSLQSLALVNQRIYNICRPLLWQKLYLGSGDWIEVVLTKHGRYVLSSSELLWNQCSECSTLNSNAGQSEDPEKLSKMLLQCPNLQRFQLSWYSGPRRCSHIKAHKATYTSLLRRLVPAFAQLQQLRHLELSYDSSDASGPARSVAELLLKLPLLENLRLMCVEPEDKDDQGDEINVLGQAISSLKQLTVLHLEKVKLYNASWPPCLALEKLQCRYCFRFRPVDAPRFVNTFAPNLQQLALKFGDPSDEPATVLKPHRFFHLPRLVELRATGYWGNWYDTESEHHLIHSFRDCANLRRIQWGTPGRPSLLELISAAVWPRLEKLQLMDLEPTDDEEFLKKISPFCRSQGIEILPWDCYPLFYVF